MAAEIFSFCSAFFLQKARNTSTVPSEKNCTSLPSSSAIEVCFGSSADVYIHVKASQAVNCDKGRFKVIHFSTWVPLQKPVLELLFDCFFL